MVESLQIKRSLDLVVVNINGISAGMSWDVAKEFAKIVRRLGEAAEKFAENARLTGNLTQPQSEKETLQDVTILLLGPALGFELKGRRWFEVNYRHVKQITDAVQHIAGQIEEEAKANQLIEDEAILLRTGLPVGLATNSKIKREAWKAAEDVKFEGAVVPAEIYYPPSVILHPPVKQGDT
jgi:hypothetical protein